MGSDIFLPIDFRCSDSLDALNAYYVNRYIDSRMIC